MSPPLSVRRVWPWPSRGVWPQDALSVLYYSRNLSPEWRLKRTGDDGAVVGDAEIRQQGAIIHADNDVIGHFRIPDPFDSRAIFSQEKRT